MYLEEVFGLQGKVALITGASRGIGQVVAEGLAKAGADIVVMSRSNSDETLELVRAAGRRAIWLPVDVTDEPAVEAGVTQAVTEFGHIDIVFNNAGICMHQTTFEATIEEFRQVIDTNLTGQFIVARAAARHMIKAGIKGSIINMASMSGSIVNIPQWQVSYNASKAAVIHMTRSLALEWAETGIRVNSLSPGYVGTPMSADVPSALKDVWMPLIPLHRMADPQELMPAVLYLASPHAGYTTGSDVIVDGGYVLA